MKLIMLKLPTIFYLFISFDEIVTSDYKYIIYFPQYHSNIARGDSTVSAVEYLSNAYMIYVILNFRE